MIKIYTDGSCLSNPGKGGWAAIIIDNGETLKISGNEKNTKIFVFYTLMLTQIFVKAIMEKNFHMLQQ